MKIRYLSILSLLLSVLASALGVPSMANAATITVNTLLDENDGSCTDGDCSLRDALAVANAGDTINFSVTGTIVLTWNLIITKNLTINGPGTSSLTISGNNASRVLYILSGANVTISSMTIANGHDDWGGGIHLYEGTLTVTNGAFSGNSASIHGGGIFNWGNPLTVTNSTFSGNSAGDEGGGIYNWAHSTLHVTRSTFSGNNANHGGGISNWATLDVANSTFSGNSASNHGGGIHNGSGTLNVTNSTFSSNNASWGGGIINWGTLAVTNSTLSGNSGSDGGGIYNIGTATLKNTIVANSTAGGDCNDYPFFTAGSTNNLATDAACSPGFSQTTAAALNLNWQGWIFALLPGSVAIDAGTNTGCPATDQRNWPRPQDGDGNGTAICDVGSYEFTTLSHELYLPLILKQ